jgi:hypothetical protein
MSVFCGTCYINVPFEHQCQHVSFTTIKDGKELKTIVKCKCCDFIGKVINNIGTMVHTCNPIAQVLRPINSLPLANNTILYGKIVLKDTINNTLGYVDINDCKTCDQTGKMLLNCSFKKCINCDGTGGIICTECNGTCIGFKDTKCHHCDHGYNPICKDCNGRRALISNRTYTNCRICKVIDRKSVWPNTCNS